MVIPEFIYLSIHSSIYSLCLAHLMTDLIIVGIVKGAQDILIQQIKNKGEWTNFLDYLEENKDDCDVKINFTIEPKKITNLIDLKSN